MNDESQGNGATFTMAFVGTPLEIGASVIQRIAFPAMRACLNQMPPTQVVDEYAGMLATLHGAMCAELGGESAKLILKSILDLPLPDAPSSGNVH